MVLDHIPRRILTSSSEGPVLENEISYLNAVSESQTFDTEGIVFPYGMSAYLGAIEASSLKCLLSIYGTKSALSLN